LDNVDEDVREEEEERSHENSRPLRTTLSRSNSNPQYERAGDSVSNRRRSQGSTRHRGSHRDRDSSAALRRSGMGRSGGRDSPDSSLDGSSGGDEEDEADEPIIELLERERK